MGEVCLVSFDRGGIQWEAGTGAGAFCGRSVLWQWGFERERAKVWRSEGENGGRRRPFIESLRIDAPLDAAVTGLMLYTWLRGKNVFLL